MEDFKIRLLNERDELSDRLTKLSNALETTEFCQKVGDMQCVLMKWQKQSMEGYLSALNLRIRNLGIEE